MKKEIRRVLKKERSKLVLNRETLRHLHDRHLERAVGGGTVHGRTCDGTMDCPTNGTG